MNVEEVTKEYNNYCRNTSCEKCTYLFLCKKSSIQPIIQFTIDMLSKQLPKYRPLIKNEIIQEEDIYCTEDGFINPGINSIGKKWNKTAYLPIYRPI